MLVHTRPVVEIDGAGRLYVAYHSIFDSNIICGDMRYIELIIAVTLVFVIFNFLPPLLLILYQIKAFRLCLSKCHLDSIALNITFVA